MKPSANFRSDANVRRLGAKIYQVYADAKMKSESGFNFAMFVIQLKNEFRFWNIDMGSSLKKEFHNASCKNGVRKRERL